MDITLNYREAGEGFPLILLHGNGEDGSYFEPQIQFFKQHYHVFAVDTRGHGGSPRGTAPFTYDQFACDLLAFMDERGLFRAHILGFSDGGIITLLFALQHSDRVDRLVLNGANLDVDGLQESVRVRIHAKAVEYAADKDSGPEALIQFEYFNLMDTQPPIDPARLKSMERPALVIAGSKDMVTLGHTQLIYQSLPHAEMVILPGDHFIAREDPDTFNKIVLKFLLGTLGPQE